MLTVSYVEKRVSYCNKIKYVLRDSTVSKFGGGAFYFKWDNYCDFKI